VYWSKLYAKNYYLTRAIALSIYRFNYKDQINEGTHKQGAKTTTLLVDQHCSPLQPTLITKLPYKMGSSK